MSYKVAHYAGVLFLGQKYCYFKTVVIPNKNSFFSQKFFLALFYFILIIFSVLCLFYDNAEFDLFNEMIIIFNIIFGFLFFILRDGKKEKFFFNYIFFLSVAFSLYIFYTVVELFFFAGASFNAFLLTDIGVIQAKLIIACFFIFFFIVLRYDILIIRFYNLEMLFIFATLAWVCILSCFSFNFLFLFLTMELLTILLVILMAIYFVFVGTRIIKPITQFFVLNVVISVFFILGFCILLYTILYFNVFNGSYLIVINTYLTYLLLGISSNLILVFFKMLSAFFILPFIFKLTLAPFSIWIINIYTHLPLILLMLLMTVYKIVYSFIYIRLFLGILDALAIDPFLSFSNSLILCFVIPSLFIGCLAFKQLDFKTFLAYTTISQIGYIFTGFLTTNVLAIAQSLSYLLIYCIHLILIFSIFLVVKKKYNITNINELFLVKFYDRFLFFILLLLLFSLAGIPPIGGFAIKIYLFLQVYAAGHQVLAIMSLISGFLMSIIYLKISIKLFISKNTFYFNLQHITYKKDFLVQTRTNTYFIIFIYMCAFLLFSYFMYADVLTYILVDFVKAYLFFM